MLVTDEGRFTHAKFMSSNKNWIQAIWMNDAGQFEEINIETDLENPIYVKLLDQFTTDEISTMTDQSLKEEELNFKHLVVQLATDYGLVYDPNVEDGKDRLSIDHIFEPPEGDTGTDLLFNIKLKIFEMDAVTESDNDDLKKQLREADTPLKAFYIAGQFLYAE